MRARGMPGDARTVPPSYRYFIDMVERLRRLQPQDLTENSVLFGVAAQIAEVLKKVEDVGFDEAILYFNVGLKPHSQIKDEMARFMAEMGPLSPNRLERIPDCASPIQGRRIGNWSGIPVTDQAFRSRRRARSLDAGSPPDAVRAENTRQQDSERAGQKNPVEGPGTADRGDRCAQSLNPAEIKKVGTDQTAERAADIGEHRCVGARENECHRRRRQRRNKHRERDAETADGFRQGVTDGADDRNRSHTEEPQPVSQQQI